MDPKISIGIDNCFAIKRWTTPAEWTRVIRDMGLTYIECVTDIDNEPLLMPAEYIRDWADAVNEAQAKYGTQVVMLYSNNSTYDTTGLAHPDPRVRAHIIRHWFGNCMDMAAQIGANLGYYVQAFPEEILFDRQRYDIASEHMRQSMTLINSLAQDKGIEKVALEQMYTPHQIPFSVTGMKALMEDILQHSGKPLYVTEDVGHHCPYYLVPTAAQLQRAYVRYCEDGFIPVWLGSREALALFTRERRRDGRLDTADLNALMADIAQNGHLFNAPEDTDCYYWLAQLGCYSPVIHLQQTDGTYSSHKGFTPENNAAGIIHPVKVLQALQKSYAALPEAGMPPRCEHLYLILELYMSTRDIGYQGLYQIAQSVEYLRRFIPRDGMRLSELLKLNHC